MNLSQPFAGDRVRLTCRQSNALDESYFESIGFPAPGRTVSLGIELRSPRR